MYPELFQLPFTDLTVKSYGLMMVVGFIVAIFLIRRLIRDMTPRPELVTNAALYALIAGIAGARAFYVLHYPELFEGRWLSVFAIWNGGLELLGGVLLAIAAIWLYLRHHSLAFRPYADALAIGLMGALTFGRIGCFLNGCCYGRPTDLPWAVRFPYGSFSYRSQIRPDPERNRPRPQLDLPAEFFGYAAPDGQWHTAPNGALKPFERLTEQQKHQVTQGKYRALPVHPTQLYSSLNAALIAGGLYLAWRKARTLRAEGKTEKFPAPEGCIFSLMFVLYGITRFFIEFLRGDNPFEFDSLTISQNLSIGLVALGVILLAVFTRTARRVSTRQ